MARPKDNVYRTAILGAFDKRLQCSVPEVIEHLKEVNQFKSEVSARRMVKTLVTEGLLTELPSRGKNWQVYYAKSEIFQGKVGFISENGALLNLRNFCASVANLDVRLLNDEVGSRVQEAIFEILGTCNTEYYEQAKRPIPDAKLAKQHLEQVAEDMRRLHFFIKSFLDSRVWSDVDKTRLDTEFKENASIERAAIIDGTWRRS